MTVIAMSRISDRKIYKFKEQLPQRIPAIIT